VGAAEVIREAGAPLLQVGIEFAGQLGGGSGAAGQSSQTVTEGEVDPFDEGRVDRAGEAGGLEASDEIIEGAEAHTAIGSPDCLVTMPRVRGLPYVYTGNASLAYAAVCYWACHIQTYHQDSQGIRSKATHTYRSWVLSRKEEFTYV
jgi:hypothetical protein